MMNWIKNIFKPKTIAFPKNTSWMLNDDLSVNVKNIKHCKIFQDLKNTKQSKLYHEEGNVLNHTLLVSKKMHSIITNQLSYLSDRDKKILMIAALCHDLGKGTTTYFDKEDNDWHCKNHGAAGEQITRNLLFDEPDFWMREEICWLVKKHMIFHFITKKDENQQITMIQSLSMGYSTIQKLLIVNIADLLGSKPCNNDIVDERIETIKRIAETSQCYTKPFKTIKAKSNYNMYVLIGIPGSGKNTYVDRFLKGIYSISRDDIREEMVDGKIEGRKLVFDKIKEGIVSDIVKQRIKKCCEESKSFIINQTNMKKKYRDQLKETAFKYGKPNVIYIYIEPPTIEECKRRRGYGKWNSIIDRMWGEFEFPDKNECDELIFYKQK